MSATLTTRKIKELKPEERLTKLEELKKELAQLKTSKVTGAGSAKLSRLRNCRKEIARLLTFIHTERKANLRKYYAQAKFQPKEFRPKLTRKLRRALTTAQKNRKTAKQIKIARHFPHRKFYVLA